MNLQLSTDNWRKQNGLDVPTKVAKMEIEHTPINELEDMPIVFY